MKQLKIVTTPHPSLTKKSKKVTKFDQSLLRFVGNLEHSLRLKQDPPGVGLSAPQVDKNRRLFSLYFDHDRPDSIFTMINPQILDTKGKPSLHTKDQKNYLEGCLSIPQIYGLVYRYPEIKVKYLSLPATAESADQIEEVTRTFTDFQARVIQHEYDHLEGILFTQRAIESGLPLYQEQGEDLIRLDL